jgi:hypothetical protein
MAVTNASVTPGSLFESQLDSNLVTAEGWTKSGTTYTSPNGPGGDIIVKALTSNVATLQTRVAHRLFVGASVTIAGVDATFNGTYTVTAVTTLTFSYAKTAADVTSVAASGTVNAYGFNLVFTLVTVTAAYIQFSNPQGQSFFLHTGASSLAGTWRFTFLSGPQHAFICVDGPLAAGTGPASATYGSHRGFFFITTIQRLYDSDAAAGNRICTGGSHTSATVTTFEHRVFVKTGLDTTTNAPAELLTMRPMVQDISALGDLPPTRAAASNIMYWPIMVCEQVGGYRGRLNNIFFGGENYNIGDDVAGQRYNGITPTVDGKPCTSLEPFWVVAAVANAGQYSPLGNPGSGGTGINNFTGNDATDGGPTIIVSNY